MPTHKTKSNSQSATPTVTPSATSAAASASASTPSAPVAQTGASPSGPLVTGPAQTTSSTGSVHSTKVDIQVQYQAMVAGLLANFQPTDLFVIAGSTYTRDELIARFQAFVSSCEDTKSSYQAWRTDVATEKSLLAEVTPLRVGVRGTVQVRYGKKSPQVLQFGFTPAKTVVRSAANTPPAAHTGAATRKARGTVGKNEKAAITGATTTPASPATASPPSPTVAPAPASPAPAAEPATPVAAPTPVTK